jgi:hypothetical protein
MIALVQKLLRMLLTPEDLHRGVGLIILWAYGYQLAFWGPMWWLCALANTYGIAMPLPPLIPWEQLLVGTTTLASISGIKAWSEKVA